MSNMNIQFTIETTDYRESSLVDDFCDTICRNIRRDIYNGIIQAKIDNLEYDLINASWINWIDKPTKLNMENLVTYMLNNIVCRKRLGGVCIIEIPHSVKLPHSTTPLEQVARFIDMGTEITPCTTFITRVFQKYKDNINDYWKSYVMFRLHKESKGIVKDIG